MLRTALVMMVLASTALAAEPVTSGVPLGQRPGPYSFLVATGPQRGQPTCYICEQDKKPTVVVFARTLNDSLGKLLAGLDRASLARKESGFKAWMTLLAETADLDGLAKWSQKQGLGAVPVGAFEDVDGPPAYKLNRDADVTILVFVNKKVTANFALRSGELTDAKVAEVLKSLDTLK